MMEFEGKADFAADMEGAEEVPGLADQAEMDTPPSATARIVAASEAGVVTLPDGTVLVDVAVDGRDLLITLDDGSIIRVPEGAIVVPQIVAQGVIVPPENVAALLVGNEPEPAAGPLQSSGGDFFRDPGAIQAAYDLGDLLPYTELAFPQDREEEIIPDIADRDPEILVVTPDNPAGAVDAVATVDEEGLPARTVGGAAETAGTNAPSNAETVSGTIVFNAPDGVSSVQINGVAITQVGQTFTSPFGTLQITSIDLTGGQIGFVYTLTDNAIGDITDDFFEMTIVDTDGDQALATLQIEVIDDQPIARVDTGNIAAGTYGPITGSVTANDTPGADGYGLDGAVTGFSSGNTSATPGQTLQGIYGALTIAADGSYSYTRDPGTPGGVSEQFNYTIVDGDGSTASSTLTIIIGDAPATVISLPVEGEAGTIVDEDGLPARPGKTPGSQQDTDSETTSGTITFSAPDGVATVEINGVVVTGPGQQIPINGGTLTIVTFDPIAGTLDYSFTLNDNTSGDDTSVTVTVTVTDIDGDSDTGDFDIVIVDDVPTASPDTDSVTEDGPLTASGNVITDAEANGDDGADTPGADGASVTGVVFGTPVDADEDGASDAVTDNVGVAVSGTYGSLTIDAQGAYTYTLDGSNPLVQGLDSTETLTEVFTYTITDGDGDTSTTSVTITIVGSDDGVTINGLDGAGAEQTLLEANLVDGSAPDAGALVKTGTFDVVSVDGLATLSVGGAIVFDAANPVTYPVTVDDPVYGRLTITGVTTTLDANGDVVSAVASYSYTLQDNSLLHTGGNDGSFTDSFEVVATDTDGSNDTASLDITIVDDAPTARADTDSVTEDGPLVADGNVITGSGGSDANASDGAADTKGADGASVTAIAFGGTGGTVGDPLSGTYGSLTISADGSYAYTLDNANPLVQGLDSTETLSEVFTYTLTDADGDTRTATLTITINGANDVVTINGLDGQGAEQTLFEDDLVDGSSPDATSLTKSGTFEVISPDGLATLTVGGTTVFDANDPITYPVTIDDPVYGRLTITGVTPTVDANGDVVSAVVSYSYELEDNSLLHTGGNDGSFTDSFAVVATDTDGSNDTASLDITIVDDVPTANDDPDAAQVSENTPFTIDALGNDEFGADGVDTGNALKVFVSSQASQGTATYDPATGLFTYTPDAGAGSDGNLTDSFEYTIIDRDGDESTAIVTVALKPDSVPSVVAASAAVDDDGFADANPVNDADDIDATVGSDPASASELVFSGSIDVDFGSDAGIVTFANLDGTQGTVGSETVDYGWDEDTDTLTATISGGDRDGVVLFTVSLAPDGSYTVTLEQNVRHQGGDGETSAALVVLNYRAIDGDDGDEDDTGTLTIEFNDDIPSAYDNRDSVTEGSTAGGNVVTDSDPSGTDEAGADDYADEGPVVDAGFVSANQGVTFVSKSVDPDTGTITIVTTGGTLTIAANGTYTFDAAANSINADATLEFSYTIVDGDGDQSTASLIIDVTNVAGTVSDNDVFVDEKGLPNGTGELADNIAGNDPSEVDGNGAITVDNATGDFTFVLDAGTFSDNGTPLDTSDDTYTIDGVYGTIVLNAETGAYTYTLDTRFDHADGNGRNEQPNAESFAYTVTDEFGNVIGTGSVDVTIRDDIPQVDINPTGNLPDDLLTFDAGTIGGTSTDTADFSGAFAIDSFLYGADGAGSLATTYALVFDQSFVEGQASNLTSDEQPIYLYQLADGTIIGSTSVTKPAGIDASVVFSLAVNPTSGVVTLTQFAEIDHSDSETEPSYDDDIIALAANMIELEATATIRDADEDVVVDRARLDLGGRVSFGDDGPSAAIDIGSVSVTHDETPGNDPDADDVGGPLAVFSSVMNTGTDPDMPTGFAQSLGAIAATGSTFGADGAGTTEFSLKASSEGVYSGLDTTAGDQIFLFTEGGVVVGRVGGSDGDAAFAIAVNPDSGVISVVQYLSLKHPTGGASHDEPDSIASSALVAVVKVTDEEGDSDTAETGIGDLVSFEDDGPSVTANGNPLAVLVLDESPDGEDEDGDDDPAGRSTITADFSGNFTTDFGADGEAASNSLVYSLVLDTSGGPVGSGLFALDASDTDAVGENGDTDGIGQGAEIMLEYDGDDIVGKVGTTEYFRISVDGDGVVTFSQSNNIWHPNTAGDDDSVSLITSAANLLTLVATAKDGDLDTALDDIDIGQGTFRIEDDGPSTSANPAVLLDDDAVGLNGNPGDSGDGSDGPNAVNTSGTLAHDFGTDGAGTIDFAAMDGQSVMINGVTVTYSWNGTTNTLTANDGSTDVFKVVVTDPSTGTYEVTQLAPLHHHLTGDDTETDATFNLTYTVRDADGDSETGTLTVTVDDDTPVFGIAVGTLPTLVTDDDNTIPDPDASDTDSASFAGLFNPLYGADGMAATNPFVYSLSLRDGNGTDSGLDDTLTGDDILLRLNGSVIEGYLENSPTTIAFTLTLNTATGSIEQEQFRAIEHDDPGDPDETEASGEAETMASDLIAISATITDGDHDQVTSAPVDIGDAFHFEDDGPAVSAVVNVNSSLIVDETDLAANVSVLNLGIYTQGTDSDVSNSPTKVSATTVTNVLTATPVFGADGAAASGSLAYAFSLGMANGDGDVDSGLNTTEGTDINLVSVNATTIVGVIEGTTTAAFAIIIDPATGVVTVEQYVSIFNDNPNDPDDPMSLAMGSLKVVVTAKDGDGDTSPSNAVDVTSLITFEDDGPTFTSKTAAILDDSDTPTGTGNFAYDLGSDGEPANDIEVVLEGFTGKVGTADISETMVAYNAGASSATLDVYDISFKYDADPNDPDNPLSTATGTVTFDNVAQTYTVMLDDPIESFFSSSIFTNTTITYLDSPANPFNGASQFEIANVDFQTGDFFAQFSGIGAITGLNAQGAFVGTEGYIQLSSNDTGVSGNSIQPGEVVDFDFTATNPGNINVGPSASATGFYILIDQFNANSEDFVVVLKLADPANPGSFITRALKVDTADVLTARPSTDYPVVGSNQGLIIIEPADYLSLLPANQQHYEIVGVQFLTSIESQPIQLYNFDGNVGASASGTTNSTGATDQDVVKIVDIGVTRLTEDSQALTLTLNVKVTDGDGDSFAETLAVNPPPAPMMAMLTNQALEAQVEYLDDTSAKVGLAGSNDNSGAALSTFDPGMADQALRGGVRTLEFAAIAAVAGGIPTLAAQDVPTLDGMSIALEESSPGYIRGVESAPSIEPFAQVEPDSIGDLLKTTEIAPTKVMETSRLSGEDSGETTPLGAAGRGEAGPVHFVNEAITNGFETPASAFAFEGSAAPAVSSGSMEALLALGDSVRQATVERGETSAIGDALSDLSGEQAIEAMIAHFAPDALGRSVSNHDAPLGETGAMAQFLDIGLAPNSAPPAIHTDPADEAALAAASGAHG